MCFSLGKLDVADEVGVGYFFTFGDGLFGDKKYCVGAFNSLGRETGFTSTLCQAEKNLAVESSQVTFSWQEKRVWRDDLAPVLGLITAAAVAMTGRGCCWRVCLVGY